MNAPTVGPTYDPAWLLAAIVDSSSDAILSKDLDGRITSWNRAAERMFGYTAEEVLGQPVTILFPPDRVDEETAILERIRRGEPVEHYETVRRRKDGSLIDISLTVSPVMDSEGNVVGASKIARDVTALHEAQASLARYARELEDRVLERTVELERTVGELEAFSYSMSHDLRAPLRAIRGFAEVLLEDHGDRLGDGAQYVERVLGAARRMDQLIQNVLAFARLSHGATELEAVDLDRLARAIIDERPGYHAPAAEVVVDGRLLPVSGHEAPLTQCLTNLLDNAVKFVPSGVTPRVRVRTVRRGDRVRIEVRDRGIGIDAEARTHLFELFSRAATVESYHGTGIGLAIVRKAVERMWGSFGVESEPGKGSTFWIELAAAD